MVIALSILFSYSCNKDENGGTVPATVTDIDSNIYNTVTIGTQVWMVENLKTTKYRDGTSIPKVNNDFTWKNLTTGAYCDYDYDTINSVINGRLYNWYAVNDIRNIAPTGWHVPTDSEWKILEDYLIAKGYNYDGTTTENKIAKSLASATQWEPSTSTGAVGNNDYLTYQNLSGFTAYPGGYRGYRGTFKNIGNNTYLWSTTEVSSIYALHRQIDFDDSDLLRNFNYKDYGLSVRCLMD